MVQCSELKKGDVFVCEDCGLELTVTKSCDCSDAGACGDGFTCCGAKMSKK